MKRAFLVFHAGRGIKTKRKNYREGQKIYFWGSIYKTNVYFLENFKIFGGR
jgi:hypothetical protein